VGIVSTVQPAVIENSPQERLVKLNLPEAGDFWVIDKSLYFTEFMELTPKLDDGTVAADFMENFFLQPLSMLSQGKIDERKFNQELGLE
jgi:hypothetical protein